MLERCSHRPLLMLPLVLLFSFEDGYVTLDGEWLIVVEYTAGRCRTLLWALLQPIVLHLTCMCLSNTALYS